MNDLEVGQLALIINTYYKSNNYLVGKCVKVLALHDMMPETDIVIPVAEIELEGSGDGFIQQRFLMPLPPLDDDDDTCVAEEESTLEVSK